MMANPVQSHNQSVGLWRAESTPAAFHPTELPALIQRVRESIYVLRDPATGQIGLGCEGSLLPHDATASGALPVLAVLPPLYPEWLGDRAFCEAHNIRFAYIAGEMANGIATSAMVIAMAQAGMLGFFGSAGLQAERVERELDQIEAALGPSNLPWGANLIHSPDDQALEGAVVDLFLRRQVRRVSASAYLSLTANVVRYAYSGLRLDAQGRIHRPNFLFAKISRPEVARQFMAPAPAAMLADLVATGQLTAEEARLGASLPVATEVTVEADSGGHTDNRPLTALFPTILELAAQMQEQYRYPHPIRVGAAGGLGTPAGIAAAFAMGAAYVLTGSINQAAVESGLSPAGREMLAQADIADIAMAPAADMFEMGVKVQVLKRGTMFSVRGAQLYELYRAHDSLDAIPTATRARLEREIFQGPIATAWEQTARFFAERDPAQLERANRDPKHKMALLFRSYLGQASKWAITGLPERRLDYQIWCGPAMGAFNAWAKDSFLAVPAQRTVVQIARNLLEGAAVVTRAQQLRSYGVPVPAPAFCYKPRRLA